MKKNKEDRDDICFAYICCVNIVCVVLLCGITVCLDTYIKAVYELEQAKVHNLRNPYYSV